MKTSYFWAASFVAATSGYAFTAEDASAATFDGLTITGCSNSAFMSTESVSALGADCNGFYVGLDVNSAVIGDGVEFNLGTPGERFVDFAGSTVTVTYDYLGRSTSPDLFVFSGFTGITGLTLLSGSGLNVTSAFTSNSIGLLVNAPTCCRGTRVSTTYGIEVAAVPLPAGAGLLLTGLAGIGLFGRRRRS